MDMRPRFWRSIALFGLITGCISADGAIAAEVGHKCVAASSDRKTWGSCDDSSDVEIIQGPPQIVWVRPSAEGSSMGVTSQDNDQRRQRLLNSIADTANTLVWKGEQALKRGDFEAAIRFFDSAQTRNPDPRAQQQISVGLQNAHQMQADYFNGMLKFDQTGGPTASISKFSKHSDAPISIEIPERLRSNPTVSRLIREEADLFAAYQSASRRLADVQANKKSGAASDAETADAVAQYKDTINKVTNKRKEIAQTVYVLDSPTR